MPKHEEVLSLNGFDVGEMYTHEMYGDVLLANIYVNGTVHLVCEGNTIAVGHISELSE